MAPSLSAGEDNSAAPTSASAPTPAPTCGPRDSGEGGGFAAPPEPATGDGAGDGAGDDLRDDGAKKRKTAAKRGIADLTPAQLARKRANDREAQRAIRERQRLRNEQYEREIAQLKAQNPYQELQAALRHSAALQGEVDELKRAMASVVGIVEPLLGRTSTVVGGEQLGQHPGQQPGQHGAPGPGPGSVQVSGMQNMGSTPASSVASPASVGTFGKWAPSPPTVSGQSQPINPYGIAPQHQHHHHIEPNPDRLGLGFVLDPGQLHKIPKIQEGINGAQDSPRYRHVPMKHDWTAAAAAAVPGMSTLPHATTPLTPTPPPCPSIPRLDLCLSPSHSSPLMPPYKNCPATCPLDSLLLDFLAERRERFAEGVPTSELIGPRYPSVSSLLNPAISRFAHPLSKVFTDILACFPGVSTLPEQVAILYTMFLTTRWQIHRTEENAARLPPCVRPRASQFVVVHPAWVDHLPFPAMRERLVARYARGVGYEFEEMFIPFTTTFSVNWGYGDADVLVRCGGNDEEEEEVCVNPVFERHMERLESWTLGEAFDLAFPELAGSYNLREGEEGEGRVRLVGTWGVRDE